ncbi:MAG: hypothetical protein ACXWBH_10060 [Candidatus Angelobacter sp.]
MNASCTIRGPADCGVKSTLGVLLEPAATVIGGRNKLSDVNAASSEEKLKLETDSGAVPGLLICSGRGDACGVVIPTAEGPKSMGDAGVVLKPGVP